MGQTINSKNLDFSVDKVRNVPTCILQLKHFQDQKLGNKIPYKITQECIPDYTQGNARRGAITHMEKIDVSINENYKIRDRNVF